MASIKFICSSSDKIDLIPVNAGQLIFSEDERCIYLDGTDRVSYKQIITLDKEEYRIALPEPIYGFYFIKNTCILWQYDSTGWTQVTKEPKQQIVFDNRSKFPNPGDFNTLYIDGLKMYRFIDGDYRVVNSGGSGEIEWVTI